MAKVVEDKVTSWSRKVICDDCKSTVEVHADDITWGRFGSFDEFETYYQFTCPACGARVNIKPPAWVQRQAKKYTESPK